MFIKPRTPKNLKLEKKTEIWKTRVVAKARKSFAHKRLGQPRREKTLQFENPFPRRHWVY